VAERGSSEYDLSVYGPNGFFRAFKGGVGRHRASLEVRTRFEDDDSRITLDISNRNSQAARVVIVDRYNSRTTKLVLERGESSDSRSCRRAREAIPRDRHEDDLASSITLLATSKRRGQHQDPIMGGLV
jgi:hypothetical protein